MGGERPNELQRVKAGLQAQSERLKDKGNQLKDEGLQHYEKMRRNLVANFFITLGIRYTRNNISSLAAESTYYLILSIVPFFIFFLNLVLFFAHSQLDWVLQIIEILPAQSQVIIKSIIPPLLQMRSETILSVGILVAFWATARGVEGLLRALNIILNAHGESDNIVIVYGKAVIFTILWTANAITSLVVMVYGDALFHFLARVFHFPIEVIMLWKQIVYITPIWVLMLTLAIFYRYSPRFTRATRLSWKKAFFSAIVGSALWLAITYLYRFYIGHIGDLSLTYGPLVGLMALFVWINLSVRAVLIGAEVTATLEDIGVFRRRLEAE